MQTFDQHLLDLLRANKISVETAMSAASNPTDFKTKLALEGGDPDVSATMEKVVGPMEIESDERF
jgi:Tfp pilus assembly ATPase PilU